MSTSSRDPAWPRLEALLDEVLERPSTARDPLLERIGRQDASLRARLEALRAADAAAGTLLEDGAEAWLQTLPSEAARPICDHAVKPGTRIGPYHIVREIGRGGMGVVDAPTAHSRSASRWSSSRATPIARRCWSAACGRTTSPRIASRRGLSRTSMLQTWRRRSPYGIEQPLNQLYFVSLVSEFTARCLVR
jgi:hypothetical protein